MADYISTQRAKFAEVLDGRDWDVFDKQPTVYVSLTGDAELWRSLPELSPDFISEFTDLLNLITDIKNTVKCRYVDDPEAGGEVFEGRWRQAFIRRIAQGEVTKLVQVLRRGWATALIDAEARLISGDNVPLQPERILQRQYVNLDFTQLGVMIDGIEATKYIENPTIEGEMYGSVEVPVKWRILSSKPSRADDGSGIITQTLAKNLVQTPDDLPAAILLSGDKALLSPFAHDITSVKNTYVWEYRWIDPDYAVTLRNTISLTVGVVDAKIVKVEDGTCNIQVLTQTNTWAGTLSQVWEKQSQFPTFAAERIVNNFSHIPLASLAGFRTTLATPTSGYKVASLTDKTDAAGGFGELVQVQEKLFPGTVSASNGVDMEKEYLLLLTNGVLLTTAWHGVEDVDVVTAMTALATAPTGYTVLSVAHNYNGTGSFVLTRTMVTKATPTAMQIQVQFPSFDDERRTYYYFGLDKTTAQTQYTTSKTVCDAGYKVDAVEIIEWRGGALAVVQRISKLIRSEATPPVAITLPLLIALQHLMSTEYEWWGNGDSTTTMFPNVADANLDAVLALLVTAPANYMVVSIGHNYSGTGKADVVRVLVKQNLTGFESAIQFPTFMGERRTNIYLGLNATDADTKYAVSQVSSHAGYKVDSVTKQEGRRGTITVIQQLSKLNIAFTSQLRAIDYTRMFGLANVATTVYLNIPKDGIAALKVAILADITMVVHSLQDNDNGQGAADVVVAWRSKEVKPRALGAIQSTKSSQFHQTTQDRLWIDINLTSQTALADAVALALAGTDPYAVTTGDTIQSASGDDAGDKTATIRQRISKKPDTYTAAEYSMQESFNPHGLREATMLISVKEYPEIAYADLATIFTTLQTFLGSPETMKGRIQVSMNGNGTFMMRAIKEAKPDWDNTVPAYVQVAVINPGQIAESKHEVATGVPVAEAAELVAGTTADTDYALDEVRMTERGNGEASIDKQQSKKYGIAVYVHESPTFSTRRGTKRTVWPRVHADDLDTIWAAALTQEVAGDYVLDYRQKIPVGNGFHNVENQSIDGRSFDTFATTYYGWQSTKSFISYMHQYRGDKGEWRCVKVTQTEYRGISIESAVNNYGTTGDADSTPPVTFGFANGYVIYRSIKVNRTYSVWKVQTTTVEDGAHGGHGAL